MRQLNTEEKTRNKMKKYYLDTCRDDQGRMVATDCLQTHEDQLRGNSVTLIEKSAYDRLAEINKVLSEALESINGCDYIKSETEDNETEYWYSAFEVDYLIEETLAKAKEMMK